MTDSIIIKPLSSLEKCFSGEDITSKPAYKKGSALRGECFSFQFAYTAADTHAGHHQTCRFAVDSPLKPFIRLSEVSEVPVRMPVYPNNHDDNILSAEPGMFPDLLTPIDDTKPRRFIVSYGILSSIWVSVEPDETVAAGVYPITMTIYDGDHTGHSATFMFEVIDASLPKQELIVTHWFHCDCLADWYNVPVFSERHWEIIESFAVSARKGGINMLLTPIFTPALDTAVGGERPTVQLIDVSLDNGVYSYGYEKLDRWIAMCDRVGIEYLEMSHLFTQWGAAHAPKIMATVDGQYKRIFGWETEAAGEEYSAFLRDCLTRLIDHLKALGADKRAVYHISDEPGFAHLESYRAAKAVVADVLRDYKIMDALSDFEFYKTGTVEHPVPATNHIEPFLEAQVPGLWTYYCCGQQIDVSNRMLAMPSARNRILGTQLYKYNIEGFLQWGFNFYYSCGSEQLLNPYLVSDGQYWVPAGDAFMVYPAPDGTPYESIHFALFTEAIQD
ncbi:MAG: DUF4091 domain-containing protein, partial [Eubacteriales bacterium]|nr:DUF4091 domain-containing protein [Eubacteriales bacterium]